jgi:hypothetical protein
MTVYENGAVIPPNLLTKVVLPTVAFIYIISFFSEAQTVANHSHSYLLQLPEGSALVSKWVLHAKWSLVPQARHCLVTRSCSGILL